MTETRRFTLDTNVLVYASDLDAGERNLRARDIVRRATELDCILMLQCLGELFRVLTVKLRFPPWRVTQIVMQWQDRLPVQAADVQALNEAMVAVVSHGMSFWDAMVWATARRAGCTVIVTEDQQDGREFGGVVYVNPFAARPSPILVEILGRRLD